MKKLIFVLCLLTSFNIFAQKVISSQTGKISLSIKYPPPDTIAPYIQTTLPRENFIDSLPIYTRDSVVNFNANYAENTQKPIFVEVNGIEQGKYAKNQFQMNMHLKSGLNIYNFKLRDEKGNESEKVIRIFYDPNIDITPPKISTFDSIETRGLKIVKINNPDSASMDNLSYINGKVEDVSGIYGLWINGEKVPLKEDNIFSYPYQANIDHYTIRAVDKIGNQAVKIVYPKTKINGSPLNVSPKNYYALVIGIQEYDDINIPSLDYPVEDASNLVQTLEQYYTFDPKNIFFLKNPTRKKIIKTLKDLREKLTENDNLLIFYAGHGYWDSDLQQGFWLPKDASLDDDSEWLSNGRVRDYIRGIKTKHTLLIADACFSGGIFKSREVKLDAPTSIVEMYNSISKRAITSGTLKEVPDKSVFVKYLLKRLKNNKNKFLPSEKLYYEMKEAVINNSPVSQTPEYGVIYQAGDEGGGSFIFIKR